MTIHLEDECAPAPMYWAAGVEYDGRQFSGWQRQRDQQTVQGVVEEALTQVADHPLAIAAAGRTDAGVHACGQVISFNSQARRDPGNWIKGCNGILRRRGLGVSLAWIRPVDEAFHARFSATSRRYLYVLEPADHPRSLNRGLVTPVGQLDVQAMTRATRYFLGEQDFSSLRGSGCQSSTPWRCVHFARLHRAGRYLVFDVQANAFLLHMVRNMVGLLLAVGEARLSSEQLPELLAGLDRRRLPATAPPDGLYLADVSYGSDLAKRRIPGKPVQPLPPILAALGGLDAFT